MENCLYQGKTICTFELKDESGLYYEGLVLEWKQAASERRLTCVECGANVYLAAGPVKEPYFAHYDLEECDYGNAHETEELKKGKRLLYHLLKRSFPDADIRARYRMDNGMYSTLFCKIEGGGAFAVDYRLQNNSLKKFTQRDSFYQENGIKPIYVMGIRQEKDTRQIDWYQNLLQSSMGYLAFLDTKNECMTLKKSFGYRIGKERRFAHCSKIYYIRDLLLDQNGQMICDFLKECEKLEAQIREEKLRYEKSQENLRRFREENQRFSENEARRLEEYRRKKELEEGINTATTTGYNATEEDPDKEVKNAIPDSTALNPAILEKCRKLIEEGNAHLVSQKYYEAIMREKEQSL